MIITTTQNFDLLKKTSHQNASELMINVYIIWRNPHHN